VLSVDLALLALMQTTHHEVIVDGPQLGPSYLHLVSVARADVTVGCPHLYSVFVLYIHPEVK
jgi:hypothetical protein